MSALLEKFENYLGFQQRLVWGNVFGILALHVASLFTFFYIIPFVEFNQPLNYLFVATYIFFSGLGVTCGAHRLWTHKTYKAKLPLRIFLMYWYLAAGMYSMVQWARDHRTHHKFSDTDADPHNAKRGFFFSHCGWLMMKRHPEVKEKGKLIDVSDLYQDPVVRFQQKYFVPLFILSFILVPLFVGVVILKENFFYVIIGHILTRYTFTLHCTWLVNSVAHLWGTKPYNKNIMAVENKSCAFWTLGEAWHNYHHVFPWDYRIGEHGDSNRIGTKFINLCSRLGLAYDLKFAPPEMIQRVLEKNGELKINEEMPCPEDNNDIKQEKQL